MACPTVRPAGTGGVTTGCLCPLPRSKTGSRLGEKKAQARMATDFLDWALADFSGYVAADELYDGPFCILSAVDNRRYKRLLYEVLDHDPTHDDIRAFLGRLKTALDARDLTLRGVTTDGSSLYPTPLAEVFRGVAHQLCQVHVVQDIVKAGLGPVSSARNAQAAKQPKVGKGRDVSRGQIAALDLKCSGTGQSALSQDAKKHLQCAHPRADQGTNCARYVARSPRRRA